MKEFILLLFAHVGPMGDGNSNALLSVEFSSKAACESALIEAKKLAAGTVKKIEGVCVEKSR